MKRNGKILILLFLGLVIVLGCELWWKSRSKVKVDEQLAANEEKNEVVEMSVGLWLELPGVSVKFPVPEGWSVDGTGRQIYENPDEIDTCKIEFDDFEWDKDFEALKAEVGRSIGTMEDVSDLNHGEITSGGQTGYFQDVTLPIGSSRAFYTLFGGKGVVIVAYYGENNNTFCTDTWDKILNQIQWSEIEVKNEAAE